MPLLKSLFLYLKYRKEINHHYEYAIKNGYVSDEGFSWKDRLNYWIMCD